MGFDFVNARGKYHNVSQYSATAIREQEKGEKKRLRSYEWKVRSVQQDTNSRVSMCMILRHTCDIDDNNKAYPNTM